MNVTDTTPADSTDDAYCDITINIGELDVATCRVFKEGHGFLGEVDDVTTLSRVSPAGQLAFSRNITNNTVTVRFYVGEPLLVVV